MHYLDKDRDESLYTKMIDQEVLNMDQWNRMKKEETGNLMDVLLNPENSAILDNKKWITWLVTNYNYKRIGNPEWAPKWTSQLPWETGNKLIECMKECTFPIQEIREILYIGVGRPDSRISNQEWFQFLGKKRKYCFVALSLDEVYHLREIYNNLNLRKF